MLEFIEAGNITALWHYLAIRISIVLVCWLFMIIACCIDFWSGTSTAKALGERLSSHKFRRTIAKMGDYIKLLFFALMFDLLGGLLPFWHIPFVSIICITAIMLIEGRSVVENSRRRKSHAGDVPDMVKQIVQAVTAKQGEKVLDEIIKTIRPENEDKC